MNPNENIQFEGILQEGLNQLETILGLGYKAFLNPDKLGNIQIVIYKPFLGQHMEIYRANFIVQVNFRDEHIARNFNQIKNHKTIIVAEYILPKTKELLRQQGIDYLDINGNCYIKEENEKGNVFLFIEGRKNKEYKKERHNRPFAKAGLKVIYEFLQDKNLINHTYRDIAEKAGVALGNINYVINGLLEEGFIIRKNKKELALTKTNELLDKWTQAYGERLKPTIEIGTFRFLNPNDFDHWHELDLDIKKTCWGGEPAANLWTNYLKPGILTIYTRETKTELIKNYKLIPDHNGNIKVYRKFWKEEDKPENKVDPILTYADLILTTDMRCLETAQMIYERYIEKNIQGA